MKRDGRVEILRCLFMFGICLLHSITQAGHLCRWVDNLMMPCVTGFVVISAWFGVSFKPSKVLRLMGVAAWCAVVVACYFRQNFAFECFRSYWFLWAYVFMMLFAPLVDDSRLGFKVVLPVLIAVFGWGWACYLPVVGKLLPRTTGLTAYSGVTFIGIYVAVRAFKRSKLSDRLTTKQLWWIVIVSAILCECGFYRYNSPFALTLTLALLLLFLRMPRVPRIESISMVLAPSMFAVYLYHTGAGFNVLKAIEDYFVLDRGLNVYVTHVLTSLIVFWGCVAIDLPRRVVCRLAKPVIDKGCQRVDLVVVGSGSGRVDGGI